MNEKYVNVEIKETRAKTQLTVKEHWDRFDRNLT